MNSKVFEWRIKNKVFKIVSRKDANKRTTRAQLF